jgi:hypothetical protein
MRLCEDHQALDPSPRATCLRRRSGAAQKRASAVDDGPGPGDAGLAGLAGLGGGAGYPACIRTLHTERPQENATP